MKKKLTGKQNKGSALITVLAVITILMVVVLSVLAMSYRYFTSESGSIYRQKGDEAARSLSQELGDELTKPAFENAAMAESEGSGLWKYVRTNLGPGWSYYDSGSFDRAFYNGNSDYFTVSLNKASDKASASRTFVVESAGGDDTLKEELPETEVVLYWEPGRYIDRLNESRLYIEVSCRMGDHVTQITKRYKLSTLPYAEGFGNLLEMTEDGHYKYQNWIWTYDGEM
ncbi:MAG: hypothetical protein IK115_05265 [Lachnospiraceae bacterium]|nr:hypothetical protein [Lachnospiraceae bacterium]